MKGICILVIAFALILSYQNNPFGTIIVGGVSILIYVFFKSRKGKFGMGRSWGFNKGTSYQHSQMEDLINFLVVQNYLKNSTELNLQQERDPQSPRLQEIEAIKNEILSLFDEE
ncbi:MAG: hypothetical protein EU533_07515 [Promethearchaeota archaeon]|nr:MAG: hypothetical protein EU533_07515 [Candidatus Lokiarchaeota archaeon]